MAIKVNSSGTVVSGLFTGLCEMSIVAINPTKAELHTLGYTDITAEPNYYRQDKNQDWFTQINFYCKAPATAERPPILATYTTFLYDREQSLYLNRFGRFAADPRKIDKDDKGNPTDVWFAKAGEIDMLMFMETICDIRKGDDNFLDTREQLFTKGDYSELRSYVPQIQDNKFRALLGVRDGKYQVLYRKPVPMFMTDYRKLWNDMYAQQSYIKEYFGPINYAGYSPAQFELREFKGIENPLPLPERNAKGVGTGANKPGVAATTAEDAPANDFEDDFADDTSGVEAVVASDDDNDLPF